MAFPPQAFLIGAQMEERRVLPNCSINVRALWCQIRRDRISLQRIGIWVSSGTSAALLGRRAFCSMRPSATRWCSPMFLGLLARGAGSRRKAQPA
jgi:hypothetical protein